MYKPVSINITGLRGFKTCTWFYKKRLKRHNFIL